MALRGTLTHRKTRRLASALAIDPCFAIGVIESLWHVTAEQAPSGDIGRMSDEDIAMELFYSGDAGALVRALTASGFLDEHPQHRLIVHDWDIHSDDATDNKLSRAGLRYANGALPRMRRLSKDERTKALGRYSEPCESVRTECHDIAQVSTKSHFQSQSQSPEPVPEPEKKDTPPSAQAGEPADSPPPGDPPRKRDEKQEKAAIGRLFNFYCETLGRSSKRYTLTSDREKKALLRLKERQKVHNGDLQAAERDLAQAIENLAASEWHRTEGHLDWTEQIFRSAEEFEKRLVWTKPTPKTGGNCGNNGDSWLDQQEREAARILAAGAAGNPCA